MLEYEAALVRILAAVPPPVAQSIPLSAAHARVLVESAGSTIDLPPFDNSSMDGYAVRAADLAAARPEAPIRLRVIGKTAAGEIFPGEVTAGHCVRLFTGSPLPRGADAVVMQEDTRVEPDRPEEAWFLDVPQPCEHVRRRGEDVQRGTLLVPAGERLTAGRLSLLAAAGVAQVQAGRQPIVGLLAHGSELREAGVQTIRSGSANLSPSGGSSLSSSGGEGPGEEAGDTRALDTATGSRQTSMSNRRTESEMSGASSPRPSPPKAEREQRLTRASSDGSQPQGPCGLAPGQIYESNRVGLAALVQRAGGIAKLFPLVPDTLVATRLAVVETFNQCDIVVTSGGVSVGEMDFIRRAFEETGGSLDFWRVAMKPGRPFMFGHRRGKLLFGLPGNPVSALVTFLLLARPALLRWQGATEVSLPAHPGHLTEPLANPGARRHFVRVKVDAVGNVASAGLQASHILSSLAAANGLVDVPPDTILPAGAAVPVMRWE